MIGTRLGPTSRHAQHGRYGRYMTVDVLGTGGMAQVFLACDEDARGERRWVAIKQVRDQDASDPTFARLFEDEARLASRIDHPNVCRVFDFDTSAERPFLVMEYLHGQPLSALLGKAWQQEGPSLAVVARIVADAARGLHAAHELRGASGALANVVHRDVSPPNLFVQYDGHTKVVDFGVARWSERRSEKTSDDVLRGRLRYMSPEQVQQLALDRRSDVFSLGVVLWEATLGRRLYARDNAAATVRAIVDEPVPAPSEFEPDYPSGLESIVLQALAHQPEQRFATALALAEALEAWALTQPDGKRASVAATMERWFATERQAREELLRAPLWSPPDTSAMVATVHDPPHKRAGSRLALAAAAALVLGAGAWAARARVSRESAINRSVNASPAPTLHAAAQRPLDPSAGAIRTASTAAPTVAAAPSAIADAGATATTARPSPDTRTRARATRVGAAQQLVRTYELR